MFHKSFPRLHCCTDAAVPGQSLGWSGRKDLVGGGEQLGEALAHGEVVGGAVGAEQDKALGVKVEAGRHLHLDGLDATLNLHRPGILVSQSLQAGPGNLFVTGNQWSSDPARSAQSP